jgi:hypothetical protein
MRRSLAVASLALGACVLPAACGLVAGLGDEYTDADAAADGAGVEGATEGSADGASEGAPVDGGGDAQADTALVENCLDGVDNDHNGLVDCADPACAAFTCIAAPPSGFRGVIETIHGYADPSPMPTCPNGQPPEIFYVTPSAHVCQKCTCDAPTGASCDMALTCYGGGDCVTQQMLDIAVNGACANGPATAGVNSCWASDGGYVPNSGSCLPSGGALQGQPFVSKVGVCDVVVAGGGGCDGGGVCVNKGTDAGAAACVVADVGSGPSCPAGWSAPTVHYTAVGFSDNQSCSACLCTPPTPPACTGGSYDIYQGSNCLIGLTNGSPGLCVTNMNTGGTLDTTLTSVWSIKLTQQPTVTQPGACAPTGGQLQGQVTNTTGTVFCCAP